MSQRIVFQPEGYQVAVMAPADCGLSVIDIGRKDVPAGVEFWIIDASDVPQDAESRAAWSLSADVLGAPAGVGGTFEGVTDDA